MREQGQCVTESLCLGLCAGRVIVLGMMVSAVVLIPVRTSQLVQQLQARRIVEGRLPQLDKQGQPKWPFVLLCGRLPDVRAFNDLYREFSRQVGHRGDNVLSPLPLFHAL